MNELKVSLQRLTHASLRFRTKLLLSLLLFFSFPCGLEAEAPLLRVEFVATGPVVDGDPGDPSWTRAFPESIFHIMGQPGQISRLTTVHSLHDSSSLYFLFECGGKPGRDLAATTVIRDGEVWEQDDNLEIFFFPGKQDSLYIQLLTNPLGSKTDFQVLQRGGGPQDRNRSIDYVWNVATAWGEEGWIVEMEVPLGQFVRKISAGEKWKANFCRYVTFPDDSRQLLSWGQTIASFHEPQNFGQLQFEKDVHPVRSSAHTDVVQDETLALQNLRKFRGASYYRAHEGYLAEILATRDRRRPYEFLCEKVREFADEYPDSLAAVTLSLRAVHPAGARPEIQPEQVESFSEEMLRKLELRGTERALFALARGQNLLEKGRKEEWKEILRSTAQGEKSLAGTAALLLLMGEREDPLVEEALHTFFQHVMKENGAVYLDTQTKYLSASPARAQGAELIFDVLRRHLRHHVQEIMELSLSSLADPELPKSLRVPLMRLRQQVVAWEGSPFFSPLLAESLALALASLDEEHGLSALVSMLHEKDRELTPRYSETAGDSLPAAVREAASLRKKLPHPHTIDRTLSWYYEAADSLDRAIEFMESFAETARRGWKNFEWKVPRVDEATMRLTELEVRRAHRSDPGFYSIPRDSFRLLYESGGDHTEPTRLEVASSGRAVLHPPGSSSLERLGGSSLEVSRADPPAVAFSLPRAEVDSLHRLLTRSNFLASRPWHSSPCSPCRETAITLFTPRSMRTARFRGPVSLEESSTSMAAVSSLLENYIAFLRTGGDDRERLARTLQVFVDTAGPERPPGESLDLLIEFLSEDESYGIPEDAWFIIRMQELARETEREAEVHGILGEKYFDMGTRWRDDTPARPFDSGALNATRARLHLAEAIAGTRDAEKREWYGFLMRFMDESGRDLHELAGEAGNLAAKANREKAHLLVLWCGCLTQDTTAVSLYRSLIQSDADDSVKALATIRMMIEAKENHRDEQAFAYLTQLEKNYRGSIPRGRARETRRYLHFYSAIDLLVDKAFLLYRMGKFEEAGLVAEVIAEGTLPRDLRGYYEDFAILDDSVTLPVEFGDSEVGHALRVMDTLHRYGRFGESAAWAVWMLQGSSGEKISPHLMVLMSEIVMYREAWDSLQEEIAERVLKEYYARGNSLQWQPRHDPSHPIIEGPAPAPWYPLERVLGGVTRYGNRDDVVKVWRRIVLPHFLVPADLPATNILIEYFLEKGDTGEGHDILRKVITEITAMSHTRRLPPNDRERLGTSYSLIAAKYALDFASLPPQGAGEKEWAAAIVDSIIGALPELSTEHYPLVFMAVAEWKAEHAGWEVLAEFVRPFADSLVEAEKGVDYRRLPLESPLLALQCILREIGSSDSQPTLAELLAMDHPVLQKFEHDVDSYGLSCGHARFITWRRTRDFRLLLERLKPPRSSIHLLQESAAEGAGQSNF